jgi:hypothetical protein
MIYHADWFISAVMLAGTYLVSQKRWYGWLFGALGNALCLGVNYRLALWGFFPVNLISIFICARSARAWYLERKS